MSTTPQEGATQTFITFIKGVAENIITIKDIKNAIDILFKEFVEWLSISQKTINPCYIAEVLKQFCEKVNETLEEIDKENTTVGKNNTNTPKGAGGMKMVLNDMAFHPLLAMSENEEQEKEQDEDDSFGLSRSFRTFSRRRTESRRKSTIKK